MKQFGKKNAVVKSLVSRTFPGFTIPKKRTQFFAYFFIRHKGKLTSEHNMEEAYITKGFNNWKKALEAFVDHQQSKAHRAAITYESAVPQLEMKVNGLNYNCLTERKDLINVLECIRFLARQGLVFRGNDGNDNLTQLFKLLNKNDLTLLAHLDKSF